MTIKIMKKILVLGISLLSVQSLIACSDNKANSSESKDDIKGTIKIVAPSGAPALSQVKIAYDAKNNNNYQIGGYKIEFNTVSGADGVKAAIASKTHDIVVAPINLGATLYKSNHTYKYAANITDGNLYLASTTAINSFADLKDKKLVFFGENTINQVVVNKVLEENGINTTNITYLASTSDTQSQLVADKEVNTVYLVAEPVLSAAKTKLNAANKEVSVLDIQTEFKRVTNGMDFLQAGVFVKDGIDSEFISDYLEELKNGIDFVNNNHELAAKYATELNIGLPAEAVLKKAIPGCNLNFRLSSTAKTSFESLANLGIKYFGGSLPDESFYY